MRVHLVLQINHDQMWDALDISATAGDDIRHWWHRDIFAGQDHKVAIHKAELEFESLLMKLGWLEPG